MGDSNFFRTVVLIIQHDEEGAMGLVLTRPSSTSAAEVWRQVDEEPIESDNPVFVGGPVPGPLIAVHNLLDCSESEVLRGLYVATQRATLYRLFQSEARVRLFSGYSGWGEGQLETELQGGGWLICDATVDRVLGDVEELWSDVIRQIGQEILGPNVDPRHIPEDPNLN